MPSWLLRLTSRGEPPEAVQWQAFRAASRNTAYYATHATNRQQVLELAEFYRDTAQFLNRAAPPPDPVPLGAPWDVPIRAVVLQPWFRLMTGQSRVLMSPAIEPLVTEDPELLAGPVDSLRAVALSALHRKWRLPSLTYGILAFTGCSRPPLTEAVRDLLWRAFAVPVFEQFRGFQGEILAAECEAHCGLHGDAGAVWEERPDDSRELVVTSLVNLRYPAYRLATGYFGLVDYRACGCGSGLPRICWTNRGISYPLNRQPVL